MGKQAVKRKGIIYVSLKPKSMSQKLQLHKQRLSENPVSKYSPHRTDMEKK